MAFRKGQAALGVASEKAATARPLRAQAALDFLMTYGWAIALVVIIAAVLFALGIFDVSNFVGNKAAGFAGVAVTGWRLDSAGTFTIKVSNQVGQLIRLDTVNVTIGLNTTSLSGVPSPNIATGADYPVGTTMNSTTGAFGSLSSGSGYTAKVSIAYTDLNSGFGYTSSGTLTGKVSG